MLVEHPNLIDKAKQLIGISLGETTDDGNITMEETRCVGACSQAPVVVVDEVIHGRVKPSKVAQLVRSIETNTGIAVFERNFSAHFRYRRK